MSERKGLNLTERFPVATAPMFGKAILIQPGTQTHFWGEDTSRLQALFRRLIGEFKCERGTKWLDGVDVSHITCSELLRLGVSAGSARSRVFHSLTIEEHFRVRTASLRNDRPSEYWLDRSREWFPLLRSVPRTICGNFSGGEQQILMLALACIGSPRILVLEEPWTGLSLQAREDVQVVFKTLRRYGTAIVTISQDWPDVSDAQTSVIHVEISLKR